MSGSIKLTPEQAKAIKESREQRRQQRMSDIAHREYRQRMADEARPIVYGYVGILIFMLGMLVGTWL